MFLGEFGRTRVAVKRILKTQQGNRTNDGSKQFIRPSIGGKTDGKIINTLKSPSLQVTSVTSSDANSQPFATPFLDQMMMGGVHLAGVVNAEGTIISPSLAREVSLLLSLHHSLIWNSRNPIIYSYCNGICWF